jgi:hypothetical protein
MITQNLIAGPTGCPSTASGSARIVTAATAPTPQIWSMSAQQPKLLARDQVQLDEECSRAGTSFEAMSSLPRVRGEVDGGGGRRAFHVEAR